MIHRGARNRLACALRRYVSGRITNDDLDEVNVDSRDRGAVAVKQAAWTLYDDLHQHKATGKYRLGKKERREVARWIIFLHSENDYYWPAYSFHQIFNWPLNLLTFGWWERRKNKKMESFAKAGSFRAWPFFTKEEFTRARTCPKLFNAGRFRLDG
jgi:hypothetical protein